MPYWGLFFKYFWLTYLISHSHGRILPSFCKLLRLCHPQRRYRWVIRLFIRLPSIKCEIIALLKGTNDRGHWLHFKQRRSNRIISFSSFLTRPRLRCSAHKPYSGRGWHRSHWFRRRIWWGKFVSPLNWIQFISPLSPKVSSNNRHNSVRPPSNPLIRRVPRGLEDVSKYPSLLAELLDSDRRWTEEDVKKLAGGNLLRVFREVERVCSAAFSSSYSPFMSNRNAKTMKRFLCCWWN